MTKRNPDTTLDLWPEGAPAARGSTREDRPWLEVYAPQNLSANAPAILICPGGGYAMRAEHEAAPIAWWLNTLGIIGVVVHYRVKPYQHPQPINDLSQAMRLTKRHAAEWNIDTTRIGVLGFSAGGHLASTLSVHYEPDTRPDLSILLYPVITFGPESAHTGSRNNLISETSDGVLAELLSNEKHVTAETPPAFIFHTVDDSVVPVENVFLYGQAMRAKGVPFEMHLYETGRHGVGLAEDNPALSTWPGLCANWLRARGFVR